MPVERRWSKFWWQDWQREPSLRMCSMAARGLWMELLCLAHDGEPYGHVTVNGRAPTSREIAGIVSATEKEVVTCLKQLESSGVFSRTEGGVIYCRRMLRDKETSDAGREAIGKRWGNDDKTKKANKGNPTSPPTGNPNTSPTSPPNRGATREPNSLEAESESEAESPPAPPSVGRGPDAPPPIASKENAFTGTDPKTGRELVGGYFWDNVGPRLAEAAGLSDLRGDHDEAPARQWLRDGIEPDVFLPIIRKCAERADYSPPRTLAYFDRPVREARRKTAS